MRNDTQKLRDAIESSGILCTEDGSGPIENDVRADGTRVLKLVQAGFFSTLPPQMQWHIRDALDLFFGERLLSVYLIKGPQNREGLNPWQLQNTQSLCVVLAN